MNGPRRTCAGRGLRACRHGTSKYPTRFPARTGIRNSDRQLFTYKLVVDIYRVLRQVAPGWRTCASISDLAVIVRPIKEQEIRAIPCREAIGSTIGFDISAVGRNHDTGRISKLRYHDVVCDSMGATVKGRRNGVDGSCRRDHVCQPKSRRRIDGLVVSESIDLERSGQGLEEPSLHRDSVECDRLGVPIRDSDGELIHRCRLARIPDF